MSNPLHDAESHAHWHFIDYPYSTDGTKGPEPVEKWNGEHDPANLLHGSSMRVGCCTAFSQAHRHPLAKAEHAHRSMRLRENMPGPFGDLSSFAPILDVWRVSVR